VLVRVRVLVRVMLVRILWVRVHPRLVRVLVQLLLEAGVLLLPARLAHDRHRLKRLKVRCRQTALTG
jgi:hypothetical protein